MAEPTSSFKLRVTGLFRNPLLEKILVFFCLYTPFLRSFIVRKVAPRLFQYPPGSLRKVRRNGIWYELNISQHIDYSIYYAVINNTVRLKLYKLIRPGSVILDIGTNIGEVLLNFAKLTTPAGKVYGFEPDNDTFKRLTRNLSLNSFSNITVSNIGLSHTNSDFPLYEVLSRNVGANRILEKRAAEHITPKQIVHTVRLDDFVKENGIAAIDFIKIDVEGFELYVLQGATQVLHTHKPKLFIELIDEHFHPHQQTARELVDFLNQFGYQVYSADDDRLISPTESLVNCKMDVYCQ